jgi:hypothetical protein
MSFYQRSERERNYLSNEKEKQNKKKKRPPHLYLYTLMGLACIVLIDAI